MYSISPADGAFRQGEILSDVIQYVYDPTSGDVAGVVHDYVLLAAQDCDLERAHEAVGTDDTPLNGALMFPASPASQGRESAGLNSKIWAHVKINGNERYQVLQAVSAADDRANTGVPDLLIDFRSYFTLSYAQLCYQLENDGLRRRAVLDPPYREHFQSRALAYLARIPIDPVHELSQAEPDASGSPVQEEVLVEEAAEIAAEDMTEVAAEEETDPSSAPPGSTPG